MLQPLLHAIVMYCVPTISLKNSLAFLHLIVTDTALLILQLSLLWDVELLLEIVELLGRKTHFNHSQLLFQSQHVLVVDVLDFYLRLSPIIANGRVIHFTTHLIVT